MSKKSISGRSLKRSITSEEILGKDVIDQDGRIIGVAEKVLIDPVSLNFIGIEIDKGFLKNGLVIGKSYIQRISSAAIFLKIKVVYEIKGKAVFDKMGAKIGVVKEIELFGEKNKLKAIIVKRNLRQVIRIPAEFIENFNYNVILNLEKKDFNDKFINLKS